MHNCKPQKNTKSVLVAGAARTLFVFYIKILLLLKKVFVFALRLLTRGIYQC